MGIPQHVRSQYERNKYLDLFSPGGADDPPPPLATLRDTLDNHVELAIARLAGRGAFVVLTDGVSHTFLASGHQEQPGASPDLDNDTKYPAWLAATDTDKSTWSSIFRKIISLDPGRRTFEIESLAHDDQTSQLSSVSNGSRLSFLAASPLVAEKGHAIGLFCVLSSSRRNKLEENEVVYLATTAKKCVKLLEFARERAFHGRWASIRHELDIFVGSRAMIRQVMEEPPTLVGRQKDEGRTKGRTERVDPEQVAKEELAALNDPKVEGEESERLVDAESQRDKRIAQDDNIQNARSLIADTDKDNRRGQNGGETTYRKIFRRAAQCLRQALNADGVLFVDGLVGFHGGIQPVPQMEQELEREMTRPPWETSNSDENNSPSQPADGDSTGAVNQDTLTKSSTRVYTSAEYQRGVYLDRPAEILGFSAINEKDLRTKPISESTAGLFGIDESFLQRLMDRHPIGALWYFHDSTAMLVREDTLVEDDLPEEIGRLRAAFSNIKQLVFHPLTDPTSLKRRAGCFAWRNRSVPIFTNTVDLSSLKSFLHVVESEIARTDAAAASKQQEAFISSVSHELRTPLHGILGAVQLLQDTGLAPLQDALVNTITTCGSALHETLTSVLSYAKINQFERRQNKYRQRRPPDAVWALTDKEGNTAGPDRDFQGLYICSNIAMLCEDILGVLEAGQSFQDSGSSGDVLVVLNIDYEENWAYYTEPGAFRRIAVNIIGNALKYTTKGSVVVDLKSSKAIQDSSTHSNDLGSGRTVTISVRDTGKGISRSFIENQLFVPFTQEDTATSHGVGLGMSIVKSLVTLLAGEISVRSEVDVGTEVSVKLPMRRCEDDQDSIGKPATDFVRNVETLRAMRLHVVVFGFPDLVRTSLISYLREWYYCEVLEPQDDARPDVVLLDESNEEVLEEVQRTAGAYGRRGVLLSIVTTACKLGKAMDAIKGYKKRERIPRPLGPSNLSKGLLVCVEQLKKLRQEISSDDANADDAKNDRIHERGAKQQSKEEGGNFSKGNETKKKPKLDEKLRSGADPSRIPISEPDASSFIAEPSEHPQSAPLSERSSLAVERRQIGVLLVDDNVLNLKLLGAFLKKNGYFDVQQAGNGAKAVEAVENRPQGFDIILMDLSMPVMDGFEATRRIRRHESTCDPSDTAKTAVIVALTGLGSDKDESDAFDAGVDFFITKPVQFPDLSKILRQCEDGALRRHAGNNR